NKYFNIVLNAFIKLHTCFITVPANGYSYEIEKNKKFYLYFKDIPRAIAGNHILAHIATENLGLFRNHKGQITQNVIAACTFDFQ
ncbi:hypothetical protein HOY80DRAFT_856574, partial [Tuber brumale]